MSDFAVVAITVGLSGLTGDLIVLCDRLKGGRKVDSPGLIALRTALA
jgi:hypothetical protein